MHTSQSVVNQDRRKREREKKSRGGGGGCCGFLCFSIITDPVLACSRNEEAKKERERERETGNIRWPLLFPRTSLIPTTHKHENI